MNFQNISTTHLENSQKFIDEMAALSARMHGMKEAMDFLLPGEIVNSSDYANLHTALSIYVSGNGMPIAIALRAWSELIEKELQKRGKTKL